MKSAIMLAALLASSTFAAATVPFSGGVVVIMYDATLAAPCPRGGVTVYPQHTVQYWFDGVEVSHIRTAGDRMIASKMQLEKLSGLRSLYDLAARIDGHEYTCQFLLTFQPGDNDEMEAALAANSIKVGRIKKDGDIWYWAQ
jgi:hypothetical protein